MGQENTRVLALCLFEWMFPLKKILWLCRPELDSAHYQELLPATSHLHCPVVQSQPLRYVWGIYWGQEVDWLMWRCEGWTWMWRVTKSKLSSLPPSSSSLELSSITVQQRIIQRLLSPKSNSSNCLCFSASIKTSDTLRHPLPWILVCHCAKGWALLGQYLPTWTEPLPHCLTLKDWIDGRNVMFLKHTLEL